MNNHHHEADYLKDIFEDEGYETTSLLSQFLKNKSMHMDREEFRKQNLEKDAVMDAATAYD